MTILVPYAGQHCRGECLNKSSSKLYYAEATVWSQEGTFCRDSPAQTRLREICNDTDSGHAMLLAFLVISVAFHKVNPSSPVTLLSTSYGVICWTLGLILPWLTNDSDEHWHRLRRLGHQFHSVSQYSCCFYTYGIYMRRLTRLITALGSSFNSIPKNSTTLHVTHLMYFPVCHLCRLV